jgi:hypothetical protein
MDMDFVHNEQKSIRRASSSWGCPYHRWYAVFALHRKSAAFVSMVIKSYNCTVILDDNVRIPSGCGALVYNFAAI